MAWTPTTCPARRCSTATRSTPTAWTWSLTLRTGLRFHDGTPVLSRDCVASIRRWASVDGFGATLIAVTAELDAPDDRTIRFRLKTPFPTLLPDALGKISPNICAIMPERLARLPASRPVPEIIGSGPFRLVASERVAGSRIVYERLPDYVPAPGVPGLTSGAKIVSVDRVEWLIMPEPASAAAAVQTGEVDWLESPPPDLLPPLRRDANLVVTVNDATGVVPILRFNALLPPFDTLAIRQAVLSAGPTSGSSWRPSPATPPTIAPVSAPSAPAPPWPATPASRRPPAPPAWTPPGVPSRPPATRASAW